jgi:hypothetical protein
MPPLSLFLYRMPTDRLTRASSIQVLGQTVTSWIVENVESNSMDCSFEQAVQKLEGLPRLFVEPDGSFVWTGAADALSHSGHVWQLDGMLYDVGGRLNRVELRGSCPLQQWRQLCGCIQSDSQLIAYLLEFRRFVLARDLDALWDN